MPEKYGHMRNLKDADRPSTYEALLERIRARKFNMAVIGLGRVGLPLASVFASKGVNVIGVDNDMNRVRKVNSGIIPFAEKGLTEYLLIAIKNKKLKATNDARMLRRSNVIVISVGTPVTADLRPDYSQFYSALLSVTANLMTGTLIVLRSTVPPKTTENMVLSFIESNTGYSLGKGFWQTTCPERIVEGHAIEELFEIPEIIGGSDKESAMLTAELFKIIKPKKKLLITSPGIAELAKLFSNVYRYVNFAIANEFGLVAEEFGVDAYEAIRIANEDYKRGGIPLPGPAGGPCLYKDGYFLTGNIPFTDIIKAAWHINESIPIHIVSRIKRVMKKPLHDVKTCVLGMAYKADSDDTRYSPAMKLIDCLRSEGAQVQAHDPHIANTLSLESACHDAEIVILAVNHSEFRKLDLRKIARLAKKGCLIVDCWGMINASVAEKCGIRYLGFGKGF
jgi:UDP-N-acetyl-D-mannosaminuronic acid dehydrogenase